MHQINVFFANDVSVLVYALAALALLALPKISADFSASRYWAFACGLQACRHALDFFYGAFPYLDIAEAFFFFAYASTLWLGVRFCLRQPLHVIEMMSGLALAVMWVLVTHLSDLTDGGRVASKVAYPVFIFLAIGISAWRHRGNVNNAPALVIPLAVLLIADAVILVLLNLFDEFSNQGQILRGGRNLIEIAVIFLTILSEISRLNEKLSSPVNEEKLSAKTDDAELQQARMALFEKIFQLVPDALLITRDSDGRYLEVNRHWERVTGYSREESLGCFSGELSLWRDASVRDKMVSLLRDDGEVHHFDAEFRHKQGHSFHVSISATRFNAGEEAYVMYVMQDITALHEAEIKREIAERELQEREKILSTVFQLVPETLTITKLESGQYLDVNRNWEPLSGYTRNEAIGHTSAELNLWADPQQRTDLIARINNDGEVRDVQVAFRHKDGHIVQCCISGTRFGLENKEYLLLTSRSIEADIQAENARVLAENLTRENEKKYATLFQLSPIPLGLMDIDKREIIEINDIWSRQFGYVRDLVCNAEHAHHFWVSNQQPEIAIQQLLNGKNVEQVEVSVRHASGTVMTCLMSARLMSANAGRVCIFSLMDVTRQYQIEKEIREISNELELRVEQRTQNLQEANAELACAMESLRHTQEELIRSEKMAALGSLVAGIAHELNTPLGNSVTVASTLQDQTREFAAMISAGQLKRSVLEQYLEVATHGADLLMRNLEAARDLIGSFKQVAVDQSSNQRRTFDLKLVLDEIIATLAPMYKKTPYILKLDLQAGIKMDSYPGPLGQIMTNFVTNAIVHAFDGRDHGEIRVYSRLVGDSQVEIIFSDDGIGIGESDQKKVFDPFFTTKLGQGGSGLGMNIVYNLVTGVLGGEIRLQSKTGEGTSFILLLPCVAPHISGELPAIQ